MKRILVVEDDEAVRFFLSRVLVTQGYAVEAAEDGWAALSSIQKGTPDLILCDINMPGLDGYGLLEKLQSNPATATIPFIFLSAMGESPDIRHGMELGADDYLVKPSKGSEIAKAIEARLAKQATWMKVYQEKMDVLRNNVTRLLPHELLTPLTGILGVASLMEDERVTFNPHQIREIGEILTFSAERLKRLIQNYLLFVELEAILRDPEARRKRKKSLMLHQSSMPVDVKNIVFTAAAGIARNVNREVDLTLHHVEASFPIVSDDLKKMAEELADNAFRYSATGTPVTIDGVIEDNRYILTIVDRGRGMTAEQIDNIGAFVQFNREEFEQQGSGLGLSIVKRLAALYDGELKIESIMDNDTTVTLSLPVKLDEDYAS
ncbi:MAG: response regulator [Candidatus Xenobiia bacterium LiM19]